MARTRKKALWLATESAYSTDPSASGAGYVAAPADALPEIEDGKEPIETNYQHGENWDSALEEGPDGWALNGVEFPLIGLATAAGDGVDASTVTDDWLDQILLHIFGVQETTEGETVTSVTSATNLVLATDVYDLHEVFPLHEASVPARERAQFNVITADNGLGDYDVAPGFSDYSTAPPTAAAIAYGVKRYSFDDDGGNTLAMVYRDASQDYTLLGGRCTSAQIRIPAGGGRVKLVTSWRGDRKIAESKASLPAALTAPAITPIRAVRSPLWFNGTEYGSSEIMIDLGLSTQEIQSTAGSEGRAGDEHAMQKPAVTMKPRFTNAINNLKRASGGPTKGRLLVQVGGGALVGGVINAMAAHIDQAQAKVVTRMDDNNVARQEVQFFTSTPGTAQYKFQLVRA